MFQVAGDCAFEEAKSRANARDSLLSYGVSYVDNATEGIMRNELVLLGAASGLGKTQMCCNIALANLALGKKVHYVALEAERFEIERRLKYQILAGIYFSDPNRPQLGHRMSYRNFLLGDTLKSIPKHEKLASEHFHDAFRDLHVFYKRGDFGVNQLVEQVLTNSERTDLIIVDHIHYFDFDDDNENRAMKSIAKAARTLALEENRPIVLVGHLRKRDKFNSDMVPGMEEFHGSSDLYKVATCVVTFAPGGINQGGLCETFFCVGKNRAEGNTNRYIGRVMFNPRKGIYEAEYDVGWANQLKGKDFVQLEGSFCPEWARPRARGSHFPNAQRQPPLPQPARWAGSHEDR